MFVYQNGKLYSQDGNKLVGVDVYSDNVLLVEGTEVEFDHTIGMILEPFEVRCKFQIEITPYIFPREEKIEKVEIKDDTVRKTKTTSRKSTSK